MRCLFSAVLKLWRSMLWAHAKGGQRESLSSPGLSIQESNPQYQLSKPRWRGWESVGRLLFEKQTRNGWANIFKGAFPFHLKEIHDQKWICRIPLWTSWFVFFPLYPGGLAEQRKSNTFAKAFLAYAWRMVGVTQEGACKKTHKKAVTKQCVVCIWCNFLPFCDLTQRTISASLYF